MKDWKNGWQDGWMDEYIITGIQSKGEEGPLTHGFTPGTFNAEGYNGGRAAKHDPNISH